MKQIVLLLAVFGVWLAGGSHSAAQETSTVDDVKKQAENVVSDTRDTVDQLAEEVDKNETAQDVSAGILEPIYLMAEYISFSAFHWIAFTLMVTGVVSFALQLVLAKLVVLSKGSLSFREILSDTLGLAISLIGLVLTTQAAAENSNFAQSAAAVLSATALGVVAGFVFYLWGQSQEIQAAGGAKKEIAPPNCGPHTSAPFVPLFPFEISR